MSTARMIWVCPECGDESLERTPCQVLNLGAAAGYDVHPDREAIEVAPIQNELAEDRRIFLDTALTIITEHELHLAGIHPRPPSVVPSPWFDGAKNVAKKEPDRG